MSIRTVGELRRALEEFPDDWDLHILVLGDPLPPPQEVCRHGIPSNHRRTEIRIMDTVRQEYSETPRAMLYAGELRQSSLEEELRLMNLTLKYRDRLFGPPEHLVKLELEHKLEQGTLTSVDQIPAEYELLRAAFEAVLEQRRNP